MKITDYFKAIACCCLISGGATEVLADSTTPTYAEDYQFITHDGGWCWFSDPRAIYVGNKMVGGYTDDEGSIWAFAYNPQTQERQLVKVYDKLQYDDHVNPSVLELEDKRIAIFFSKHGGKGLPIYYRISKNPGDISEWGKLQKADPSTEGRWGSTYSNPIQLSTEKGRTYIFYRGPNYKPNFMISEDGLKTWSKGRTLIEYDDAKTYGRPYAKYATNNKNKIFVAFTDAHPRGRADNSIYFIMYKDGKLCKANGEVISPSINQPVSHSKADKVYDATKTLDNAWIWDVAFDKDENPVLVYARFAHANSRHSYWYARWNGKSWENHRITDAGIYFMRCKDPNDKNYIEKEENYSGGVYLDHKDPTIVYTSRPINNVFEIEKWKFNNKTKKWSSEAVTKDSERDNIRPYVVRNCPDGMPNLLWEYNYEFEHFKTFVAGIRVNQVAKGFDNTLSKDKVAEVAQKVADWQIREYNDHPFTTKIATGWKNGVMFNGMVDWAEVYEQRTGDDKYYKFIKKVAGNENWAPGNRIYHADDICISQAYLDMYTKYKQDIMLLPTKARLEWLLQNAPEGNIDNTKGHSNRWWWCDALYMAPSTFTRMYAITGDKAYLKYFDKEFKACYNQLYDKDEKLFFRDSKYLNKKESNGKKVFWGRGNGWVLGGLAEVLKTLPAKQGKYRSFYEELFRDMSTRLIQLQDANGYWHASLLDPETYADPETSSTGLIIYALAYGVNSGLLDKETFMPSIEKGWKALVKAVDTEGKVGWVQPIGQNPKKIEKKSTELYGIGGFLLSASEIYKMLEK